MPGSRPHSKHSPLHTPAHNHKTPGPQTPLPTADPALKVTAALLSFVPAFPKNHPNGTFTRLSGDELFGFAKPSNFASLSTTETHPAARSESFTIHSSTFIDANRPLAPGKNVFDTLDPVHDARRLHNIVGGWVANDGSKTPKPDVVHREMVRESGSSWRGEGAQERRKGCCRGPKGSRRRPAKKFRMVNDAVRREGEEGKGAGHGVFAGRDGVLEGCSEAEEEKKGGSNKENCFAGKTKLNATAATFIPGGSQGEVS